MNTMTDNDRLDGLQEGVDQRHRRDHRRTGLLVAVSLALLALVLMVLAPAEEEPGSVGRTPAPAAPTVSPSPGQSMYLPQEVQRLHAADHYLRLHPDPAQVRSIYDPANPTYAEALDVQTKLAAGELRYDPLPQPWAITSIKELSRTPTEARVVVTYSGSPAARMVDRSGRVVIDRRATNGERSAVWTLRWADGLDGPTSGWRILASEAL